MDKLQSLQGHIHPDKRELDEALYRLYENAAGDDTRITHYH